MGGGDADPKYKDYPKQIDKIMESAKEDMTLYKGAPLSEEEIEALNGVVTNKSYTSTSYSHITAQDYADKAYDMEDERYPVVMKVTVKKGTPIADARKLLGTGGMKGFEKEVTVGRNTKWKYSNLRKVLSKIGETEYHVDVEVFK